jgi:hypothetical protein
MLCPECSRHSSGRQFKSDIPDHFILTSEQ